ncbi:DUF2254 domain-containing protein [Nonomuraea sp. SYSU D8015]|uniref:DUF2254 domain-containing protein n=1 Tax=Nonomuraea sp. SYSU D8015 TaxID=2593644 RepID=UPI001CB71A9B|nr:DUF2254 domain-containing protein [Nonomuraea sp. SYSU D8015]
MRWSLTTGARRARGPWAELWTWPTGGAVVGWLLAMGLVALYPSMYSPRVRQLWPGDSDAATAMLQVIAAAVITVTALTFTLTVVALQLASQQFSPRLLRDFIRDRVTKAVLALLVGTFVYALTVLRSLHREEPLPELALLVAFGLGLASLASVIAFISHITRVLRVDTMMLTVHDETARTIATFYPAYGDERPQSPHGAGHGMDPDFGEPVIARRSGFLRYIHVDELVRACERADAFVRVDVRAGDHIVQGTPVASVWSLVHTRKPAPSVFEAVHDALNFDYERTVDQDAAFGFRQLEDIAVKALSPAINDPVTATHAIGHMADLLVTLCGRKLGPTLHTDAAGRGRVVVPDRDLRYYLELACGQVRRYGAAEPTVLKALLAMLRDVAAAARNDEHRTEIERQVCYIIAELPASIADHDAEQVHDMAERVRLVLVGQVRAGFVDRSGETRST